MNMNEGMPKKNVNSPEGNIYKKGWFDEHPEQLMAGGEIALFQRAVNSKSWYKEKMGEMGDLEENFRRQMDWFNDANAPKGEPSEIKTEGEYETDWGKKYKVSLYQNGFTQISPLN